jgi:hypothetical protein
MEKLKKAKVTIHICPTCKGNGYVKVATEGKILFTNVGTVIRRENFMRSMILVGLMMVVLTACTKDLKFDGFDPATSVVRWVFTNDK